MDDESEKQRQGWTKSDFLEQLSQLKGKIDDESEEQRHSRKVTHFLEQLSLLEGRQTMKAKSSVKAGQRSSWAV